MTCGGVTNATGALTLAKFGDRPQKVALDWHLSGTDGKEPQF